MSGDARLPWLASVGHRAWLAGETTRLLDFYQPGVRDPEGGFHWLDTQGRPLVDRPKHLWLTARMVHCFAIAELLGRPGAGPLVDHGLDFLTGPLQDHRHGGWSWSVGPGDARDDEKHAYGHAFVVLAASSALQAGHPHAAELLNDALHVLDEHFWEPGQEMYAERFAGDWSACEDYRGANSHMHLTEALMAAAEATGRADLHTRAAHIAERIIADFTAHNDWRLPEHFDGSWTMLPDYNRDHPDNEFRPYGSTIGHWLEWARLLLQLRALDPGARDWMTPAAERLFAEATDQGWSGDGGGFVFTVDWDGRPLSRDHYHWVTAEAIGAAAHLYRATGNPNYDRWYQTFWDFAHQHLIDARRGSWFHQLDPDGNVTTTVWEGKPDLYHALQASLVARLPSSLGITEALRRNLLDADLSEPASRPAPPGR